MTIDITGAELGQFIEGASELVVGPAGGLCAHRIPQPHRDRLRDAFFRYVQWCPAGVRLRFRATGPVSVTLGSYSLTGDAATISVRHDHDPGAVETQTLSAGGVIGFGPDGIALNPAEAAPIVVTPRSPGGLIEVLLDHRMPMEVLAISGDVTPAPDTRPVWLHYGSSISHGLEADAPHRRWPEQVAAARDLRLRDLSFAGNAQLDPLVGQMISDAEAAVISLAVGINLVNSDSMRERVFVPALHGLLDTIRQGHPSTPIVLSTAIAFPAGETTPGPDAKEADGIYRAVHRSIAADQGALTVSRTRELIADVVAARADPQLTLHDGRDFLGPDDTALLVDGLHPGQDGIDLIAGRVIATFDGAAASD